MPAFHPYKRAVLLSAIATVLMPVIAEATDAPAELKLDGAYTCKQPQMPVSAIRNGASGDSRIAFVVGPDGGISGVVISGSAGDTPDHQRLDLAAVDYVRSCRYTGPGPMPTPGTYSVVVKWGFA